MGISKFFRRRLKNDTGSRLFKITEEENGMVIGYYREKEGALEPDGCDRVYKEREGSDYILNAIVLNGSRGDKIVIRDVEDIGKSEKNMQKMMEYMRMKGMSMVCVSEDGTEEELTGSEMYEARRGAELKKREEVSERIKEGIARAREEGKQIGGEEKYKVEPEKEDMIMKAYELGIMKWEACAKELGGMSKSNFYLRYDKWKKGYTQEINTENEAQSANEPEEKWKGNRLVEIGGESTND